MRNLILQYYVPYENMDKDMGGADMPPWAKVGKANAQAYAESIGVEYRIDHDRRRPDIDPRLESCRIYLDKDFEEYDNILLLDLDMLLLTDENVFDVPVNHIGMVHELGIFSIPSRKAYAYRKMDRGYDYAKQYLPSYSYPKSTLYPTEEFRYLNGGFQMWTKEGRQFARENFLDIKHWNDNVDGGTEQPYINTMLAATGMPVTEFPQEWDSMDYQWQWFGMGKIAHFLNRTKFRMPQFVEQYKV